MWSLGHLGCINMREERQIMAQLLHWDAKKIRNQPSYFPSHCRIGSNLGVGEIEGLELHEAF
eukprot:CAMPEP_0170627758 /NCGR_PEP_ID=MMETSP0224-20130122/32191_1 /TAXON_ID=285029 /ORGANISM="Togula jolla, Strain CCCM 725" /LENGTH=61 /DNA_ID=CAMNT_0010954877 /DNA_START=410 /DNA_END=595 /DNA_ORIENTATION=+